MAQFIDLTPHAIFIHRIDGSILEVQPSGTIARVSQRIEPAEIVDGIAISRRVFSEVEGLPEERPAGVYYIVSSLVLDHASDRTGLVVPGTPIRDEEGRIIGCDGLVF